MHLESVVSDNRDDPSVAAIVLNTRDVSERHEMERVLEYRADHDTLTGLVNRDVFARRVDEALVDPGCGPLVAVVLIDLDDFKTINDSLGHGVGDTLLVEIADRITRAAHEGGVPARLGGDEFVLLVPDASDVGSVEALARDVIAAIGEPIHVKGHDLVLHASAGIATDRDTSDRSADGMLRDADLAMYAAKQRGPGHVVVYDPLMGEGANRRLELVSHLNHAAERGELSVAYQPIIDLATNQMRGVEALLRWNHPVHGSISPMLFIRLAEETGRIRDLGRWLLDRATRELGALRVANPHADDLFLSVNVSTRELEDEDFAAEVATTLARVGFNPDRLWVEVTETAFMRDPETLMRHLEALKELGVTVAVDDFGTGYSSLAYLARLPIDIVKIDRAFVLNLAEQGRERRIADMIMRIGEILGVRAVAEGIEVREQRDAVRDLGCELGQGYLIGHPMPVERLAELVRDGLALEV